MDTIHLKRPTIGSKYCEGIDVAMRKLKRTLLAMAAVSVAVLIAASASSVSADTVKVFYDETPRIHVDFVGGQEINKGGKLTIDLYSDYYDMEKTGMMFYEFDKDDNEVLTSSVTLENQSTIDGKVVRRVFSGLTQDIKMYFCDFVLLEPSVVPGGPGGNTAASDNPQATFVLVVLMFISAVMLVFVRWNIRKTDLLLKELEAAA